VKVMRISARQRDRAAQTGCLDRASLDRVGAILRATYEGVTKEPIPNEHIDLLLALRHKERERRCTLQSSSPQ